MRTLTRLRVWWRRRRRPDAPATCAEVALALQSYLDGRIDDATARRVAEHLETCRGCGLEAHTYRELRAALARRGRPSEDVIRRLDDFATRLLAGEEPGTEPADAE